MASLPVGTDLAFAAIAVVFVARDRGGARVALAVGPRERHAVVGHVDVHVAVRDGHEHAVPCAKTDFSPDHGVLGHGALSCGMWLRPSVERGAVAPVSAD